jgi:hypothetical protein
MKERTSETLKEIPLENYGKFYSIYINMTT